MEYFLRNVCINDKQFVYETKKASIKKYIAMIWGWNEEHQSNLFEEDFILLNNFKIICSANEEIGYLETYENDTLINITEIHIHADFQGKGFGSKIIRDIVHQAKNKNKKVTVGSFKENKGAVKLYTTLGFKIVNETDTHFLFEYNFAV